MISERIFEILERIECDQFYCLIIPNVCAGRKRRYSVIKIYPCEGRRVQYIGRELDLKTARSIAKNEIKKEGQK